MMIKRECRAVSRQLWDYVIGRLSESETDRVEMHVARCAACRRELQSTKITAGLVTRYKKEPEPESQATWHALRAEIEHAKKSAAVIPSQPVRRGSVLPVWAGTLMASAFLATVWSAFQAADSNGVSDALSLKKRINSPVVSEPPCMSIQLVGPESDRAQSRIASEGSRIQTVGMRPAQSPTRSPMGESPAVETVREPESRTQRNNARRLADKPRGDKPADDKRDAVIKKNPPFAEPQREFVMGSIPASGSRIAPASYGSDSEEAPVW